VAAAAARSGAVVAFGPSKDVPIFDSVFTGRQQRRGYRSGGGPQGRLGSPLGGRGRTGGNMELRFPPYRQLMGAVFLTAAPRPSPAGARCRPSGNTGRAAGCA